MATNLVIAMKYSGHDGLDNYISPLKEAHNMKNQKRMLNTRLPKLYFADAAYLLLQYNFKRIEPLSPRGMSGQVEFRMSNVEGKNKTSTLKILCSLF